jgi:hypothetical protein
MKRLIAIGLLVTVLAISLIPSVALAGHGIRIYAGVADTLDELAFTVEHIGDGEYRVYRGYQTGNLDNVVLTLEGKRIYKGYVLTADNVLFTIKGERIIPGLDSRATNAVYTVRNNRIYAGTRTTLNNVLYTFSGSPSRGRLFRGISTGNLRNIVFTIGGDFNEVKFLLPILADGQF